MEMIAMQSKTFWRPVSSNTIMVAADTGSKRKELEQNVMKTFYLINAASPADLQQAAGTLKAILDINKIQVTPEQRSLTLRGTPDQMVLAQKLLTISTSPRPRSWSTSWSWKSARIERAPSAPIPPPAPRSPCRQVGRRVRVRRVRIRFDPEFIHPSERRRFLRVDSGHIVLISRQ